MPRAITVLVIGATGQQGGAVARLLLDKGHEVRALTRRPRSPRAAALQAAGAEIREGDLDDGRSVHEAAEGADAVFLMATPFEEGVDGELRQARRGAEACMQAGVKHLVYSSVAGADRETGVPHFESKRQVELFLRGLGVPITILAPVFFMENLLRPAALQALSTGTLTLPLPRRRALRVVSVQDVAAMARLAFERPGVFQGKRIELAADDLTGPGMAAVLSQVTRSTIGYAETPLAAVRERSADLARMFEWLAERGYDTDIERLRAMHPEVGWHDFRSWARQQDWSVLDVASAEQPTI